MPALPRYLYHRSSPENRKSILENGLLGNHDGHWAIYLSARPDTWKSIFPGSDLFRVDTAELEPERFSAVDPSLDELLYWGKPDGEHIAIPKRSVELIEKE